MVVRTNCEDAHFWPSEGREMACNPRDDQRHHTAETLPFLVILRAAMSKNLLRWSVEDWRCTRTNAVQ